MSDQNTEQATAIATETHELTGQDVADRTRPSTVRVDRLPSPFVRSGENRVIGSADHTRSEIRRLQKLEKEQEREQQRQEAEARDRAVEWERLEKSAYADLRREVDRIFADCPGKPTATPILCASCYSAPPIVKDVSLRRPGSMDERRTFSISAAFPMKRLASGMIRCPRCGTERYLAGA